MLSSSINWGHNFEVESWKHWDVNDKESKKLTNAEAIDMMLSNNSRIRLIGIGADVYTVCPVSYPF